MYNNISYCFHCFNYSRPFPRIVLAAIRTDAETSESFQVPAQHPEDRRQDGQNKAKQSLTRALMGLQIVEGGSVRKGRKAVGEGVQRRRRMRMRSGGSGAHQPTAAVTRDSDFLHPAVKTGAEGGARFPLGHSQSIEDLSRADTHTSLDCL